MERAPAATSLARIATDPSLTSVFRARLPEFSKNKSASTNATAATTWITRPENAISAHRRLFFALPLLFIFFADKDSSFTRIDAYKSVLLGYILTQLPRAAECAILLVLLATEVCLRTVFLVKLGSVSTICFRFVPINVLLVIIQVIYLIRMKRVVLSATVWL